MTADRAAADVLAGFVDLTATGALPPADFVDDVLADLNARHGRTDARHPDPHPNRSELAGSDPDAGTGAGAGRTDV